MILRADGEKQARIMEAEAEAAAILRVEDEAMADALKLLNESNPNDAVIKAQGPGGLPGRRQRQVHQDHHPLGDPGPGRPGRGHRGDREAAGDRPRPRHTPRPAGEVTWEPLFPATEQPPLPPMAAGAVFHGKGAGLQGEGGGGVSPGAHLGIQCIQALHVGGEQVEPAQQVAGVLSSPPCSFTNQSRN